MDYEFTGEDTYIDDILESTDQGDQCKPYVATFDGSCSKCGAAIHREKTFYKVGADKSWREWFSKQKLLCPFCYYKTKEPIPAAKPTAQAEKPVAKDAASTPMSSQYENSLKLLSSKLELIRDTSNTILDSLKRNDFTALEQLHFMRGRINKAIDSCEEQITEKIKNGN